MGGRSDAAKTTEGNVDSSLFPYLSLQVEFGFIHATPEPSSKPNILPIAFIDAEAFHPVQV